MLPAVALALCANTATAAPSAYVTNAFATPVAPSNVSVIDTATNTVSTTISFPAGAAPYAVAMTSDLQKIYVTSMDSRSTCGPAAGVYIIDTATQQLESTSPITVGCEPTGIAITPDGLHAYVANQFDGTISVIDTAAGTVSQTIQLGVASNVNAVAVSPDGGRAYVTGRPGVFVLDTSTNAVLGSPIPAGNAPYGLDATPDGKSVYVTDDSSPSSGVTVIDVATGKAVKAIAVGNYPSGVAITPDGKFAYVADGAGGISVIDTAAQAVVGNPIPANGGSIAFTADGKQAYVASEGGNDVSVIDTAAGTVTTTVMGMNSPRGVATRPLPPGFPVPNYVGRPVVLVGQIIAMDGFAVGTVAKQSSPLAPGTILTQQPAAGALAGHGAAIDFVFASGIAVPNVVGQTQAAATTAVTAAGLTLGTVAQQSSASVAPGSVISQNPASGTNVAGGSPIDLVVSMGVAVPNVVGQTQAAATTAITAAGLTLGTVTQQSSGAVVAGGVISQSPAAGTNVAGGSAVNVIVSTGSAGGSGGGYGGGGGVDWLLLGVLLGFVAIRYGAAGCQSGSPLRQNTNAIQSAVSASP